MAINANTDGGPGTVASLIISYWATVERIAQLSATGAISNAEIQGVANTVLLKRQNDSVATHANTTVITVAKQLANSSWS